VRSRSVFRWCRTVHAWAGAALSLLLFVLALSGTALVFKDDYVRLVEPAAHAAPDLSQEGMVKVMKAAEVHFDREQLSALVFASHDFGLHKVYLRDDKAAYLASDGSLIDTWEKNGRVEDWVFDLHHYLLAGRTGAIVAGSAGLAACVLVLTGLIAVWPMRRGLRRGLKITNPSRMQLRSLHRNLGVISALPVLVILLTGAAMVFPLTAQKLLQVPATEKPDMVGSGELDWATALEVTNETFPQAAIRIAIWPREGRPAMVRARQPAEWHPNGRSVVLFDPDGTRLIETEDATKAGFARETYNAIYPVHAAGMGGRLYDALVALTGIALMLLSVLGLVTFLRLARKP